MNSQFPQININHQVGNTITIPNQLDIRAFTYTSNNVAISATALPVDNANDFTSGSNILLLLSSLNAENAEILTSSTHTNTSMTVSALSQLHTRGEIVQEIKWDQIQIYKSLTIDGSYTILGAARTLQVTQANTVAFDLTGLSTDYYKVQWKNSITGDVSGFSERGLSEVIIV